MKRFMILLCVVGLASATAQAAILVDRGLPTEYLNNSAGNNRSNVTWQSTNDGGFIGDDFVIGTVGQTYLVDSLTVWGAQYNPLSDDVNNISLYLGKAGGMLNVISTGSVTGNTDSNPNISHTYVTYSDGTTYEGNGNIFYPICQTTFSGLDFVVQGGVDYYFGVLGTGPGGWWAHASNAALSGSPQQGSDNKYLEFNTDDLNTGDSDSVIVWDSNGNGWDKSSDINVVVTGSQVPEPATIIVWSLLGLVGYGVWRRRRAG